MRRTFVAANGHCSTPENVARFLDTVYQPRIQASEIADPAILTLILECDGRWAGFAQLRWATPAPDAVATRPAAELGRIYLDPAFHGRGLAAALMARLFDEARAHGARALWLHVWQEAPQAIRFYGKHGFRIVGTSLFAIGDDPKDDWVMARELDA